VRVYPSTIDRVGKSIGNQQVEGPVARPAFLKINSINLSVSFPKSELLRFSSTVKTTNGKIRTAYTLFNSGASHGFVDTHFACSLGLVPQKCGTMIVTTANQTSNVMDCNQVYLYTDLRGTIGNRVPVDS
jgi:hypothetical protein